VKKGILLIVARARADEVKRQMDEKTRDFLLASDRIVLVATNMLLRGDCGWCTEQTGVALDYEEQ